MWPEHSLCYRIGQPRNLINQMIRTEKIPLILKQRRCWVVWRREKRHKKFTKIPYNARTGAAASSTDPATWSTFDEAMAAYATGRYSGIGYVLNGNDQIVGVDLDHCRDKDTGEVQPWAKAIVSELDSYSEVSPSGTGIRIFVCGTLPAGGRKRGHIEVYRTARYLTVTGDHLPSTPSDVEERNDRLTHFYESTFRRSEVPAKPAERPISRLDDEAVIRKAKSSGNGFKFARLFSGDWSDYPSQSEADLALCTRLAFWCGRDAAQIDRELSVRLYTGRPVSGAGRRTTPATWNGRGAMGQSPVGWSRLEYAKEPTDRNGGTKG